MTGGELCKLLNVAMSTTIWDIKEPHLPIESMSSKCFSRQTMHG